MVLTQDLTATVVAYGDSGPHEARFPRGTVVYAMMFEPPDLTVGIRSGVAEGVVMRGTRQMVVDFGGDKWDWNGAPGQRYGWFRERRKYERPFNRLRFLISLYRSDR